jgi:hypothetical protein
LDDIALESYVIEKVAPLLATDNVHESIYDPKQDHMNITIGVDGIVFGMSLADAVEKLGIRPLAFGSA